MLIPVTSIAAVTVMSVSGDSVFAHHPLITGTAACADDGGYVIDYTSEAWEGFGTDDTRTNPDVIISAYVNGAAKQQVGSGAYAPPSFSFSDSFTLPAGTTSLVLEALAAGDWGNGAEGGQTATTNVALPGDCTPPTTTTTTPPTTTTTTTTAPPTTTTTTTTPPTTTTTTAPPTTTTTTPPTTTTLPPRGDDGCTPGYWKNHTESWQGYTPGQTVSSVFTGAGAYGLANDTLLQALGYGGGSDLSGAARILLRAATAALLNSAHSGVDYPATTAAVIADVNAALASNSRSSMLALAAELDADNNLGCTLN